jgi:hypothetical protein
MERECGICTVDGSRRDKTFDTGYVGPNLRTEIYDAGKVGPGQGTK